MEGHRRVLERRSRHPLWPHQHKQHKPETHAGDRSKVYSELGRTTSQNQFLGERTVAAVVVGQKRGAKMRVVAMQVVWSTVSRRDAARHVLTPGALIWRRETSLFQFETFRRRWCDEGSRQAK